MRVDAHHHLWRYTAEEFGWIDDSMASLRRNFLLADLRHETIAAGIDATVAVQARQTLEETRWLLETARTEKLVRGVVGWAPIASEDFERQLETLCHDSLLKGLRHVVQAEPAGFLDENAFNRGIRAMRTTGLVYEILITARQLPEAARFVDRHPQQIFVLDHIGKPNMKSGTFAPWAEQIRDLALRPNIYCKVSGMVTEADWSSWSANELKPYFDTVVEAFGPARLMAGSDWPVLTVACGYGRWWQTLAQWTGTLSDAERHLIEGQVAERVYALPERT